MSAADLARFWAYAGWFTAREFWASLPGPWWAKTALVIVLLAIPGELDEFLLLAVLALLRRRRAGGAWICGS